MRFIFYFAFILLFSFCGNHDQGADMNRYFATEIRNRRQMIDQLQRQNDSLKINTAAIDEEINNYILLSKDIENLSAAVNKANAYFLNMANSYDINYSDFTKLSTDMHLNVMATVLKQNELNLLNQLIFKMNRNQAIPFTAQ